MSDSLEHTDPLAPVPPHAADCSACGVDRPDPAAAGTSRRTILRTAGLVAVSGGGVALLAACGADAGTTAPAASSAPASSAPSSAASSTPEPSASTSSSAAASKAPTGPSVATSDVPVGGGVILADANFVVTQPTKGTYKAFSKICTHMGCPVALVENGNIICKCHGSQFSIKDGSVTKDPATKPLAESATEVSGGKVYVTG